MNKAQRIVVLTGISLIALSCLFPTWKATFSSSKGQVTETVGYSLLFYPPEPYWGDHKLVRVRLDFLNLVAQFAFVGVVAGGAFFFFSDRGEQKPPLNRAQRIVVLTGITIIALSCLYPPWRKVDFPFDQDQKTETVGYGLLLWPPGCVIFKYNEWNITTYEYGPTTYGFVARYYVRLDLSRLALQFAFVFAVAAGAFICFSDRGEPGPPPRAA